MDNKIYILFLYKNLLEQVLVIGWNKFLLSVGTSSCYRLEQVLVIGWNKFLLSVGTSICYRLQQVLSKDCFVDFSNYHGYLWGKGYGY